MQMMGQQIAMWGMQLEGALVKLASRRSSNQPDDDTNEITAAPAPPEVVQV